MGGGVRHLVAPPASGGLSVGDPAPPPLFLKVLILPMYERRRPGVGSCEASHAGVGLGTNCIEMCPSKRGPQGEGTRGLRRRLAQDPPGGPKVPVARLSPAGPVLGGSVCSPGLCCPHRGSCPTPLPALPPAPCLWQTPSVGTTSGGPRGWRWWLAAGVWGEVAWLGGPPRTRCPSVDAGRGCQARLVWSGGDGRVLRRRRAAGGRPPAAGATETRSSHLLSSWLGRFFLFFPVCLLSFSPPVCLSFPSRWEAAGSVLLLLSFH